MNTGHCSKLATTVLLLSLAACGGGGGSSSEKTQSISGVVADPEIKGASVILWDAAGSPVGQPAITGADGVFTFTEVPEGDLAGYKVVATGGKDMGTGVDFDGLALTLPLALYEAGNYSGMTVNPVTSLIASVMAGGSTLAEAKVVVARQLGLSAADLLLSPSASVLVMNRGMKLTMLLKHGLSFSEIHDGLTGNDGIGQADLTGISDTEKKARLMTYFGLLDAATVTADLIDSYQESIVRRTVRASLKEALDGLAAADNETINRNLHKFAQHMINAIPVDGARSYLVPDDVVATISSSGLLIAADLASDQDDENPKGNINNPAFDATRYTLKLVSLDATFSDTLQLAFYAVNNPLTGNEQLVVHDAVTNTQKVVKTDIILGNRAFVFDGHTEDGKEIYDSRKYGIFLDPSQSKETRSAPDGRGGTFDYTFYFDNSFKRYDIAAPVNETLIYGSALFPQSLVDQGMTAVAGDYTLHNNISDADNSYVELKAFESLPDTLKGESESSLLHGPILVRMGDSAMAQGHMIRTLKGDDGKTEGVLTFYEAIHKSGVYPEGEGNRVRLQLCQPDLSGCDDITEAGGIGDGKFFYLGGNNDYVYMAKHGSETLYAYKVADKSLSVVTGVSYPAPFNHKIHTIASAAHGAGAGLRRGFSNLSGSVGSLSDGENAYVRINYDGDALDPVASYRYLGDIHVYKHTQILKLTAATGIKMFDNGDGVDDADLSDDENVVGHASLVAAANGKLIVEIGNYEGGNGGSCTPDMFGYYCSSVYYGYLNSDSRGKTELDVILKPKALLKYFVSRRIAPYALGGKLYISTYVDSSTPYVFTLDEFDIANPDTPLSTTTGRTYFTKTAQRTSGVYEGTVLSWDGATGVLTNLSRNESMGIVQGEGSVIAGDPAINSVSGLTSGAPVAGIGNLFALKADPGGHRFYLVAGDVNQANGLEYIDHVPFSSWLYE